MTGSGTAAGATELGEVRIEIRSVNGRALLLKQRLCTEAAGCETAIEERVRRRVQRGTLTLVVERSGALPVFGDRAALRTLVGELRSLARDLGVADDLSLRDVLAMAGAATARTDSSLSRELPPQFAALLDSALLQLHERRVAEGRATLAAMRQHLAELGRLLAQATARAPELAALHRDRLLRRLNEFLASQGVQLQPAEVVREVALYADRTDTSEELQRLQAHIGEVETVLHRGGEVGRRLDFLLQELLREANTLGSKSPDVQLSHAVVAMKSCIDKLKEQAANLE
jgi:uncharacterized protein (TIGR00255 family)